MAHDPTVETDLANIRDLFISKGFTVTKDRCCKPQAYIEVKKRGMGTARVLFEGGAYHLKLHVSAPGWGSMWHALSCCATAAELAAQIDTNLK